MRVTSDGDRVVVREAWPGFATVDIQSGSLVAQVDQIDPSPVTMDIGMSIPTADGRFASSLDADLLYKIWSTSGGDPIYTAERDWVITGLNADASLAVIKKDHDPMARIIDTSNDEVIAELDLGRWSALARFSPDERYVIGGREGFDSLVVFDASDGSQVAQFGGDIDGLWFRFTPSGDNVVWVSRRGDILIYDFAAILNGAEDALVRTIPAHDSFVFEPAISPDGTLLATSSQAEGARVWEIETGRFLGEIGDNTTKAVAFHPWEKY